MTARNDEMNTIMDYCIENEQGILHVNQKTEKMDIFQQDGLMVRILLVK